MKVALCLCGVVGGDKGKSGTGSPDEILEIGYEHYKRHILEHNDVDVFVHTWTTEKQQEIEQLYNPKKALYEEQIFFDIPDHVKGHPHRPMRRNNHYSRWYSTKQTIALKQQYEQENNFEYDFVMVARFDIAWQKDVKFSQFDSSAFYAGNWNRKYFANGQEVKNRLYYNIVAQDPNITKTFINKNIGYPHNEEGLIDFWFFANSNNMDKFATLFDRLDTYAKPGNCPTDHEGSISNHRLSLYHLQQEGLIDKLFFAYQLHDDFPLIRRWHFKCGR